MEPPRPHSPPHSHPCQFIFYLHHQGRWFDKLPLACLRLQDTKQHHVWLVSEFNGLERSVLYQLLLRRNPCLFDNGCSGAKKTEAYCSMQEVRANTAWPYPEVHINVRHVGHATSQRNIMFSIFSIFSYIVWVCCDLECALMAPDFKCEIIHLAKLQSELFSRCS